MFKRFTPLFRSGRFARLMLPVMVVALVISGLLTPGIVSVPTVQASGFDCNTVTGIPVSECRILITLYASTSGAGWIIRTDWGVTTTPCTWYGVACSGGHVTEIDLPTNQLNGSIPSLNGLTSLQNLGLPNNQLSGSISSLSGLTSLQYLDLSNNQLSGTIPSLNGLTNLITLWLYTNQLSGSIPSLSGLTSLQYLALSNNQLSGSIPSLTGLTNLQHILLGANQLSGGIPYLPSSLVYFDVSSNLLDGIIPDSLTGTQITSGDLYLCGIGNNLSPADVSVNTFVAARITGWTGQCGSGYITATPTITATNTSTPTVTPTNTNTSTATNTATPTSTATATASDTNTATATPTNTSITAKIDSIGIYRGGTFYLRLHNSFGFADISVPFIAGTKPYPVVGDWTGGSFDTIGIFDQNTANFYLRNSNSAGSADEVFTLGNPNDTPLSGRWQISATHTGAGVYRPSNGVLYLKNTLTSGFADNGMVMGIPGDEGISGDWTGKGFDSPGIYRPSGITFYLSNKVTNGPVFADITATYGSATDVPIAGDWIAQGHDGIGMFRPTNGYVYLKNAITTGYADNAFFYGTAGDVPVSGHWQVVYPPKPPAPVLIAKTAIPQPGSISVQSDNRIGD